MKRKAKISILSNREKQVEEVNIEIKNNKINYQENYDKLTNVLYDMNNKILIRENNEIYMEYNFITENAFIYIKELKKEVNLSLTTKNIKESKNKIDIEYLLDNEMYRYIIDME